MNLLDYIVLAGYFALMMVIGFWAMKRVKAQEDYLLGGRRFGKWLQAFAAFGAGTGSSDPVNTARTSFTSGMSGMWSVMSWLFVTPIYWFAGVWYRRMRHLTLGDWFVERYESKSLGGAYAIFGLIFYMVYTSMLFSAIGKVAAPLIGDAVQIGGTMISMEYILVPIIALIVVVYGVLGGLAAAYWTDVLQGIFIILLSIILIPFGLDALVVKFGNPESQGIMSGFKIIHEQLPEHLFTIVGSEAGSEFPLHRIIAVTIISLLGIVVMPHFIATGGGSAKNEINARVGLVMGNLAKRFCTIGWALTALIVLALYSDNAELISDPDKAWGIASRELLWPGLRGLMLACMLAALMSSADTYMLVTSGLIVRNLYVPYLDNHATDQQCLKVARLFGGIMIIGAVLISWFMMDVFKQLQLTWIVPMIFAAPFWMGMFWRGATAKATWAVIIYTSLMFFIIPWVAPLIAPQLKSASVLGKTTDFVETTATRNAVPSDVKQREANIKIWENDFKNLKDQGLSDETILSQLAAKPAPLSLGEEFTITTISGGKSIYWSEGVIPNKGTARVVKERIQNDDLTTIKYAYEGPVTGNGNLRLEFLVYDILGFELSSANSARLASMELLPKIVFPFLVMIIVSLLTKKNDELSLNRLYIKMRTPVVGGADEDKSNLESAFNNPDSLNSNKLFPGSSWEFAKPKMVDVVGFLVSLLLCFFVVGLAIWVAQIGA